MPVHILKHHGSYMQQNRELKKKADREKSYQFMLRLKVPCGEVPAAVYRELDDLSNSHGQGDLRATTRQAFQLHGVIKGDLKTVISRIANVGARRAAGAPARAEGAISDRVTARPGRLEHLRRLRRHQPQRDDARGPLPQQHGLRLLQPVRARHRRPLQAAHHLVQRDLARRQEGRDGGVLDGARLPPVAPLSPPRRPRAVGRPRAQEDIKEFDLDKVRVHDNGRGIITGHEIEPLYGNTYLPKKFKIAFTVPGDNSVDLYINDIGCVVIMEPNGVDLKGFNIVVGGGMGRAHKAETNLRTPDLRL